MNKKITKFGWRHLFKCYGYKGLIIDSIFPVLLSLFVCYLIAESDLYFYCFIKISTDKIIAIVPSIIGMVLAAFAIVASYFNNRNIQKRKKGERLIENLNANFAVCLFASTITLLASIIINYIQQCSFCCQYASIVNCITTFLLFYMLLFSICTLFSIIIDIFNTAQTSTFL